LIQAQIQNCIGLGFAECVFDHSSGARGCGSAAESFHGSLREIDAISLIFVPRGSLKTE